MLLDLALVTKKLTKHGKQIQMIMSIHDYFHDTYSKKSVERTHFATEIDTIIYKYIAAYCVLCEQKWISSERKKLNSVAFSPQANYTDRATGFLDRSRYFSIQVAPQLSSRG
jgi:hypothetical protein